MDYVVVGGDERLALLAGMLSREGYAVGTALRDAVPGAAALPPEALAEADRILVNWPPRIAGHRDRAGELLRWIGPRTKALCLGPGHPAEDRRLIDLWTDEALLAENARLTAEGAVSAAMRASSEALFELNALIIGWGRVGRALTELLIGLGAPVTVASRSESNRNRARERGARAADTADLSRALPRSRLILNTAPGPVLDGKALAAVPRDALLIDLASPPYGIDLRAAWALGLRAWREPALPGRYCPRSAAGALLRAIHRWEGGAAHD